MGAILILHLATFFFFLAYGLTVPTLPVYLKALGLDPGWIGWAVALMPLAGLLLRPWGGWVTDARGRKLPALVGLFLSALAGLFYLGPLPLVLAGRFLQGAGMALFAPSTLAMTSDLAPPDAVGRVMGTRNLLLGLGVMLGSALGGLLLDHGGPGLVFLLVTAVQLPWAWPLLKLPETLAERVVRRWWQGFFEAARIRAVLAATWANAGFAAAFSALQAFYPIFLVHRGFSASVVGAFFGYYSFVSVLARLPSGVLVDRMEARRVAAIGFILATLGFFLLWRWPLPWPAFVAGTLIGAGAGTYLPANIVVVTRAAPAALRGSAFSLFTASWDLGGLLGPPLAGLLLGAFGDAALFPFTAALALFTTLTFPLIAGKTR